MSQSNWCFLLGVTDFNAPRPQAIFEHYPQNRILYPVLIRNTDIICTIYYICVYTYISRMSTGPVTWYCIGPSQTASGNSFQTLY